MESAVDGPEPAKLVAEGIRVHFEGVRAVDGVDLTLEQGQIMGLIGPNGAGKTTFMNAVSGFVPLNGGTVTVDGVDMSHWPPHRRVANGLVRTFQDVATFPELSVFENVELGALGAGLNRRAARRRASELIEGLGLQHVARLPASALPHGDERRVGIARAVAVAPQFLLLDEPAAGLDDAESRALTSLDRDVARPARLRRAPRRARHADHLPGVRAHPGARLREDDRRRHAGGDPNGQAGRGRIPRREGSEACCVSLTSPSTTVGSRPSTTSRSRSTRASSSASSDTTARASRRRCGRSPASSGPRRGEITFEGRSIVGVSPDGILRRGIALVPENRRIFSRLSRGREPAHRHVRPARPARGARRRQEDVRALSGAGVALRPAGLEALGRRAAAARDRTRAAGASAASSPGRADARSRSADRRPGVRDPARS